MARASEPGKEVMKSEERRARERELLSRGYHLYAVPLFHDATLPSPEAHASVSSDDQPVEPTLFNSNHACEVSTTDEPEQEGLRSCSKTWEQGGETGCCSERSWSPHSPAGPVPHARTASK